MHRCQTARRLQSRLVYLTHLFYKGPRNLIGDGPAEPPGITRRARVTHPTKVLISPSLLGQITSGPGLLIISSLLIVPIVNDPFSTLSHPRLTGSIRRSRRQPIR